MPRSDPPRRRVDPHREEAPPGAAGTRAGEASLGVRIRRPVWLFLVAVAGLLVLAPPADASRGDPDSVAIRFELGTSTDVTNEEYYEDTFLDSISLGRRLVSSPESRVAGILFASILGTRGLGAVQYRVQNELSLGDKIQREALGGSWRNDLAPEWRVIVAPRVEYRRDRTFDRDLEELRGSLGARLRRSLLGPSVDAELGATGEFLRTSGQGADFLLDRNAGKVSVSVERFPLFGSEWRLGYGLAAREFPDSSARDHLEHGWDGQWRRSFEAGGFVGFEVRGAKRLTLHSAPTSRDRFWQAEGAVEGEARVSPRTSLRARVGLEAMTYDQEDTTLFFNYRIVRAQVAPRIDWGPWNLSLGPRGEVLRSAGEPAEEYREIGGALELELLDHGAWWSVTPAGGWRDYNEASPSDTLGLTGLHSSYAFTELAVFGDQPIPGALRLRLLATVRYEWHLDAAQDARSLYFSLDLRRLF